jgi:hypothetical protein
MHFDSIFPLLPFIAPFLPSSIFDIQVDPAFGALFTGVAVTKNFVGSPHRDKHDINYQYALSLGDFAAGTGELCVEESPTAVACIDTHNKIACMDGRYVHWVTGYTGNRYSLIWYQTQGTGSPKKQAVWS